LGKFFRHVNARLSSQANISCIMDGNTMVLDDYAKANVFNKYFASIGNIDRGPVPNFPSLVNNEKCMRDVTVTESDVLRAICKMKANASSGPGLPPVLFKKLKHSLTTPRTLIYNQLLSVAEVPADRKKAFVVPVFKKRLYRKCRELSTYFTYRCSK